MLRNSLLNIRMPRRKAATVTESPVKKKAKKEAQVALDPERIKFVWERASKYNRLIGAHISAAGGVHNAVKNALDIGYSPPSY